MLLNICNNHYTEAHFIFSIFVSMSRSRSIYAVYIYDLFFIFSLIFIVINHITSFKQTHLFFVHFLECLLLLLDDNVDEENKLFSNSKSSASGCCLAFASFFANFSLVLLIKVLLLKKACSS